MNLSQLLELSIEKNASDLHLASGLAPYFRIDGDIIASNLPIISHDELFLSLQKIMGSEQIKIFDTNKECDFSIQISTSARFRVNVFQQNRGISAAFRVIPNQIKTMDELKMPPIFHTILKKPRGLILITGTTGSGKSTTLAAMINALNAQSAVHILTIEDPIEFIHSPLKALINQREVHRDTNSFNNALRAALREDPDIILIGELRDLETMRLALTAAETGHLVFATLHTASAAKTINRIIDVFPEGEKSMIRAMLSESLEAIISQTLLKKEGGGRTAAWEILLGTPAIRNLIREGKVAQIYSAIQTGGYSGMQTLDQHLKILLEQKIITKDTASQKATNLFG